MTLDEKLLDGLRGVPLVKQDVIRLQICFSKKDMNMSRQYNGCGYPSRIVTEARQEGCLDRFSDSLHGLRLEKVVMTFGSINSENFDGAVSWPLIRSKGANVNNKEG